MTTDQRTNDSSQSTDQAERRHITTTKAEANIVQQIHKRFQKYPCLQGARSLKAEVYGIWRNKHFSTNKSKYTLLMRSTTKQPRTQASTEDDN